MSLRELFEEAIAFEQKAQQFYKKMLDNTMDPLDDKLLKWLISQEEEHERKLKERYKAILDSLGK